MDRTRTGTKTRGARRGFTLIEMIVVVAITAILLVLLLGPLGQAFNLTSRGQALVSGQDNVRTAMSRIRRDMANAMFVHLRPVNIWHYNRYETGLDFPQPMADASPERLEVPNACIDLVLPKHRYYCPEFRHHLTDAEVAPGAAIDSCPRHPGAPVDLKPMDPLRPESVFRRYFIGLREPGYPENPIIADTPPPGQVGNPPLPHYLNGSLFQNVTGTFDNNYILYMIDFPPGTHLGDPASSPLNPLRNWRLKLDANGRPVNFNPATGSGDPYDDPTGRAPWAENPNFFYDRAFRAEWKKRAVAVMSIDNTDAIRLFSIGDGAWRPESMVRFVPTPVEDEAPQPNRPSGAVETGDTLLPSLFAPVEYLAEFGHWTGLNSDLSIPIPPQMLISNSLVTGALHGPRLQVYESDGRLQQLVYDSAILGDPTNRSRPRRRLLAFDPRRGIVTLAIHRSHEVGQNSPTPDGTAFSATVLGPNSAGISPFTVDLSQDQAFRHVGQSGQRLAFVAQNAAGALPVPTSLGATRQMYANFPPDQRPEVVVVPGSETLQLVNSDNTSRGNLRRVGWTGIGPQWDRVVAQSELAPDEYSIDYATGIITLSERDPTMLSLRPGNQVELWVRYQFQTNGPRRVSLPDPDGNPGRPFLVTDTVRVSYSTREVITTNVGVMQYAARTHEGLPVRATQKIRVRNMTR